MAKIIFNDNFLFIHWNLTIPPLLHKKMTEKIKFYAKIEFLKFRGSDYLLDKKK